MEGVVKTTVIFMRLDYRGLKVHQNNPQSLLASPKSLIMGCAHAHVVASLRLMTTINTSTLDYFINNNL